MGRVKRRAVFLDRDGTLNVRPREHEYVSTTREFVWLPGAADAVTRLSKSGYLVAVVSNQRGVARGLVTLNTISEIEEIIQNTLRLRGAAIDAFRYCFHAEEEACSCRKPKPGMVMQLANELRIDLDVSWMVGDSDSDMFAGRAAGCRTVLIGHARGRGDFTASSLWEASTVILMNDCQPAVDSTGRSNSLTSA